MAGGDVMWYGANNDVGITLFETSHPLAIIGFFILVVIVGLVRYNKRDK